MMMMTLLAFFQYHQKKKREQRAKIICMIIKSLKGIELNNRYGEKEG
jgi:hypothetical protein